VLRSAIRARNHPPERCDRGALRQSGGSSCVQRGFRQYSRASSVQWRAEGLEAVAYRRPGKHGALMRLCRAAAKAAPEGEGAPLPRSDAPSPASPRRFESSASLFGVNNPEIVH